jgi:hypothetical protein
MNASSCRSTRRAEDAVHAGTVVVREHLDRSKTLLLNGQKLRWNELAERPKKAPEIAIAEPTNSGLRQGCTGAGFGRVTTRRLTRIVLSRRNRPSLHQIPSSEQRFEKGDISSRG